MATAPGSGAPVDSDILKAVLARIDKALQRNRAIEWLFVGTIIALVATGLVLTVIGLASSQWECFVPGGLFEVAVAWPVTQLRKLRDANIRLATVPVMIQMAGTAEARALTVKFVERLIEQV